MENAADRDIEPEFLQRLGMLVISWATIDKLLSHIFIGVMDSVPGSMYVVTENISSYTITNWIRTILEIRPCNPPEYANHIREVLDGIEIPRADRNALVHGLWSTRHAEPGSVVVQTVRLERTEIVKGEVVTLADLDEHISQADEIATQLNNIMVELGFKERFER